jgi:hypothetical protein
VDDIYVLNAREHINGLLLLAGKMIITSVQFESKCVRARIVLVLFQPALAHSQLSLALHLKDKIYTYVRFPPYNIVVLLFVCQYIRSYSIFEADAWFGC